MLSVLEENRKKIALKVTKPAVDQVESGHGLDGFVGEKVDREFIQGDEAGEQVEYHPQPKEDLGSFGFCIG